MQNHAQKVDDELRGKEMYHKFVEQLNIEQSEIKTTQFFYAEQSKDYGERREITESNL